MRDEQADYNRALAFATQKHQGQFRVGGAAYITHPVAVAEYVHAWGYGTAYRITALFHDLLEDTDASEAEILDIGGAAVLEAVRLLTKTKGYDMAAYIGAIRENEMAKVVKAADRLHNLRSAVVAGEDFKRRYILETVDWYLGFSPEIPKAVKALAATLATPLTELPFLYEPIDTWKLNESKGDIKQ